jgi:hypothetical protein
MYFSLLVCTLNNTVGFGLRVSVISLNHGLSWQWQSDTMKLSAFTEIMVHFIAHTELKCIMVEINQRRQLAM